MSFVSDVGSMTQWQLVRLRYSRHRLAVLSLFVLGILYLAAILADIVTPYDPFQKHLDHLFAPPQTIRFSLAHGIHTYPIQMVRDPITLTTSYIERRDRPLHDADPAPPHHADRRVHRGGRSRPGPLHDRAARGAGPPPRGRDPG